MGLLDWIRAARTQEATAASKPQRERGLNPAEHGHSSMREFAAEIRGDEALAKLRDQAGREPEGATTTWSYQGTPIKHVWQPGPYKVASSGYLVQPCVGWSAKGYHPGLIVKPPNGRTTLQWGEALPSEGRALEGANSAFSSWMKSHESDPDLAKTSRPKDSRGWDR